MGYLLSRQFYEFAEKCHSFAETWSHTNLGHHPELNFVESSKKNVEIGCYLSEMMTTKSVIKKFVFVQAPKEMWMRKLLKKLGPNLALRKIFYQILRYWISRKIIFTVSFLIWIILFMFIIRIEFSILISMRIILILTLGIFERKWEIQFSSLKDILIFLIE